MLCLQGYFQTDNTTKPKALQLAVLHTVTLVLLIILLLCLGLFLCQGDGTTGLEYIHRIILVSTGAVGIFMPFDGILIYGIIKDRLSCIRLWIISIILQQTYIFCVCFGANVYMAIRLNVPLGITTVACLGAFVAITMECLIYINCYYQSQKEVKTPQEIDDKIKRENQIYVC